MTSRYKLAKAALTREIHLTRVVFCIALILFFIGLFFLYWNMYTSTAGEIKTGFIAKDSTLKKEILGVVDTLPQIKKLQSQFLLIQEIKKPFLLMGTNANTMWYTTTTIFTICSIVFGILGFLVAKQGWDNINNFYLKSSFLILFFITTFCGIVPTVFNNKESGRYNLSKYLEFDKIQIDIYDLVKDNRRLIMNKEYSKLDTAVSEINSKIKSTNDFYFDLKTDQVPKDYNIITNQ